MFRSSPYDKGYSVLTSKYTLKGRKYKSNEGYSRTNINRNNKDVNDNSVTEAYVSRTLYLCKLPYDMTEDVVRELCETYGDLKKVAVYPQKGIAFVEYYDIRQAEKARNILKTSQIQGREIDVQYSQGKDDRPSRDTNTGTLYVRPTSIDKELVDSNTVDDYKKLFGAYGDVKKVSCNRKRSAEKFIEFYDIRGAEASQKALNRYDFNGFVLEIQFANTHSRTINSEFKSSNNFNQLTNTPNYNIQDNQYFNVAPNFDINNDINYYTNYKNQNNNYSHKNNNYYKSDGSQIQNSNAYYTQNKVGGKKYNISTPHNQYSHNPFYNQYKDNLNIHNISNDNDNININNNINSKAGDLTSSIKSLISTLKVSIKKKETINNPNPNNIES